MAPGEGPAAPRAPRVLAWPSAGSGPLRNRYAIARARARRAGRGYLLLRARPDHLLGTDGVVELLFREQTQRERRLFEGRAFGVGLLRDLSGVVVADDGVERCD